MKLTFRELFNRLDANKKMDGVLSYNGDIIRVEYLDNGGWRLMVEDEALCMNMSSDSLDEKIDYEKNLAIGFARYYNGGALPLLVFSDIAEASCATSFGGVSMSVAPLYIKNVLPARNSQLKQAELPVGGEE